MPTVHVDLRRELFAEKGEAISRAIHEGLVEGLDMPADDLFQAFNPHDPGELVFSPTFGGVDRRDLVWLRITMVHMFDPGTKQRMCRAVARRLEQVGIRHEDLLISLVEVGFEDWYAGGPVGE
ncbi:MAG TPA: tautomerase family protein [Actinotalea sp.]|nr:tautomerase family protein [Actinotalea sp.]